MIATVEIAGSAGKLIFRLRESTYVINGMELFEPFEVEDLPGLDSPEAVQRYGDTLTRALQRHTAVELQLNQLFGIEDMRSASLRFEISAIDAEGYRWETLFRDPDFLALRGFCNMVRIVASGKSGLPPPCTYDGLVRIVALLSPAQVACRSEFDALANAFAGVRQLYGGDKFTLQAYIGEGDLLAEIMDDIAQGALPGVSATLMPASKDALELALSDNPPQILHCFCHGVMKDGVNYLEFATRSEHARNSPEGSVRLSLARLKKLQELNNATWVTVLNSCSGAEAAPRISSMAATLTRSSSPVTIGMAEKIHEADARQFTDIFYPLALRIIGTAAQAAAQHHPVSIDLGPAISETRAAMHRDALAGDDQHYRRWCVPVMYERASGLKIVQVPSKHAKVWFEGVAELLQMLPADTPKELRQRLRNILRSDTDIDPKLWPDLWGNTNDPLDKAA